MDGMRDYLLKSHKSCSTIFQELQRVSTMPMKQNESVREFSARIKQISDEAQTVITAKYKEETREDLTVSSLFELMACESVLRQMQAHPKLRHDYNTIVNELDGCMTLETLGHKASKIADRQVNIDLTADPRTFLSQNKPIPDPMAEMCKQMNAQIQKQFALMAKQFTPGTGQVDGVKSDMTKEQRKAWNKEKWTNPEWRKKVADNECRNFRDKQQCTRKSCPFKPCNKMTTGNTLYTTLPDFL